MDSPYYSQYNDHICINDTIYLQSSFVSDEQILIEFDGKDCCQVSNITTIPTTESSTCINVNTQVSNVADIAKYNDIDYNESNLTQHLQQKNALQFTSLAIDTYLTQSNYIFNYSTNKIVSIHSNDDKLSQLESLLQNLKSFEDSIEQGTTEICTIPKDISVKCLVNDEYIWRSDESLTYMYYLPMLVIKIMFNSDRTIEDINFIRSYNNFTYSDDEIGLYNYDENSKYTASRTYKISDIKELISNEYANYINECLPNIIPGKYYYFYFVNLTNEFVHFDEISEYNFYSDDALKQYTLLVFNESLSNKKLLSINEITKYFIDSWKIKTNKKTVDDIKRLVNEIKTEYKKCSQLILNLSQTNND